MLTSLLADLRSRRVSKDAARPVQESALATFHAALFHPIVLMLILIVLSVFEI
jgi:hypothetical protein